MKNKKLINVFLIIVYVLVTAAGHLFLIFGEEEIIRNEEELEVGQVDNVSSREIPKLNLEDEKTLEMQEVEDEGFKLQGEIAYEGSNEEEIQIDVGDYVGLTYYSQVDSRWKNVVYTSTDNNSQTIGSSGCGPTCGAMIVSSIKGTVTPDKLAKVFVQKGFRSANSGTYWSAFRWIADSFDINYKETYNFDEALELVKKNNLIVVSCGNGLFTTGGHFVVIVGIEGSTLKIYDPYLYLGKFNTSTRRGKAEINGNTVFVTIDNFKKYANYKNFFCFENMQVEVEEKEKIVEGTYKKYVKVNTSLNVRLGSGVEYARVDSLYNGDEVTIYEEKANWSRIGPDLWVCTDYLSEVKEYFSGVVKVNTSLNVRSGPGVKYLRVDSLYNGDKIVIYEINNGWYKIGDNQWVIDDFVKTSTVGEVKFFKKTPTYIYSTSDLRGISYEYLGNTKVEILENLGKVDKIYVPATKRVGYVRVDVYK